MKEDMLGAHTKETTNIFIATLKKALVLEKETTMGLFSMLARDAHNIWTHKGIYQIVTHQNGTKVKKPHLKGSFKNFC